MCCLDTRCAVPCDKDVPLMLNLCGATFFYYELGTDVRSSVGFLGCCATIEEIRAATKAQSGGAPTTVVTDEPTPEKADATALCTHEPVPTIKTEVMDW